MCLLSAADLCGEKGGLTKELLFVGFCLTGSEDSFDEIQESDVIRSQPVGQIAFGARSPTARLPEVALVTGEEGEKHIVQVQF